MSASKKLKLTPRGRYAIMAMIGLAQKGGNQPIPLADIAEGGSISLSYLEQLFAGLRTNGLVKSYRGPGGGYVLAKPSGDITIADILAAAEDCVPARRHAKDQTDSLSEPAEARALWDFVGNVLHASLRHISLDDVVQGRLQSLPLLNKVFETLD